MTRPLGPVKLRRRNDDGVYYYIIPEGTFRATWRGKGKGWDVWVGKTRLHEVGTIRAAEQAIEGYLVAEGHEVVF